MRDFSNKKYVEFGIVRVKEGYRVCSVQRFGGNEVQPKQFADHPATHLAQAREILESVQQIHVHRLV